MLIVDAIESNVYRWDVNVSRCIYMCALYPSTQVLATNQTSLCLFIEYVIFFHTFSYTKHFFNFGKKIILRAKVGFPRFQPTTYKIVTLTDF